MTRKPTLFVLIASAVPLVALGLGIRLPDQDPFATARGEAFAATADRPSAVYYNPAGLTQLEGHQVQAGVYGIALNSDYRGAGVSLDTRDELNFAPQVYYAYAPREFPLAFGLGFYSPYGLSLEWPDAAPFRTVAREGQITYLTVHPVVAWRVTDTLSIAAGPTFNYSEARLEQGVVVPGDNFRLKGDDTAVGFTAGVLWRPHPQHAFGVSYRSATTLDYRGRSSIRGVPMGIFPFDLNFRSRARAEVDFPQNVVVGWSFRPTPDWNLEVNVDWTDWDSLDTVTVVQPGSPTGNGAIAFNWQSSFFYEFGLTRYFGEAWRVSGGYIFSENSVPERFFSPVVPDSDRHIFSLGIGRGHGAVSWDVTYQFAWGPDRTINNPAAAPNAAANGRYEFTSHAVAAAVLVRF